MRINPDTRSHKCKRSYHASCYIGELCGCSCHRGDTPFVLRPRVTRMPLFFTPVAEWQLQDDEALVNVGIQLNISVSESAKRRIDALLSRVLSDLIRIIGSDMIAGDDIT